VAGRLVIVSEGAVEMGAGSGSGARNWEKETHNHQKTVTYPTRENHKGNEERVWFYSKRKGIRVGVSVEEGYKVSVGLAEK